MSMHFKHAGAHQRTVNKCNTADDVLVRLDSAGFIVDASHNASRFGLELDALLVKPHIADVIDPSAQARVTHYFEQIIAGEAETLASSGGVEFPLHQMGTAFAQGEADTMRSKPCCDIAHNDAVQEWCSLKLARVEADEKGRYEALGTLRAIEPRVPSQHGSAKGISTDTVTGLCGRRGFAGRLSQALAVAETVSVALFAVDGMKAIYMNYGQNTADEVRWGFARFLEAVTEQEHFLAQVDDERFGVILPGMTPREAREWCADALALFAGLTGSPAGRASDLTASAGVASTEISAEWTLRQAELGLIMARSAGGMQTGYCRANPRLSDGEAVERAIARAAEQAAGQVNRRAS